MAISLQVASAVRVTVRGTAYLPSPLLTLESETRASVFADAAAASATAAGVEADAAAASASAAASSASSLSGALGASFITSASESSLSGERVLTDTATVTWDRSTPGQIKATAAAAAAGSIDAAKLAASALGPRVGMINGALAQSRASNAETFAIKTLAGTDPSASDPVYFVFRTATGGFVVRTVTAALSVVASSGSTLGATNSVPFRVWCVAADDAGTVRLGIVRTVSGTSPAISIMALNEWGTYSSTAEGGAGAADSAQVIYSGTAFTSKYICLVGFGDWDSGLAAVGTWGTAPTRTVLYGPGVPAPGERVQVRQVLKTDTFTSATTGTLTDVTGLSVSITPQSAANIIRAAPRVSAYASGANSAIMALIRGSTNIGGGDAASARTRAFGSIPRITDTRSLSAMVGEVLDAPGTTSSTTYKVQFVLQGGTLYLNRTEVDDDVAASARTSSGITLEEIMA